MTEDGTNTSGWGRRFIGSRSATLYVSAITAVGSAFRLNNDLSVFWLTANILLLVTGVVGFALVAFRPALFRDSQKD